MYSEAVPALVAPQEHGFTKESKSLTPSGMGSLKRSPRLSKGGGFIISGKDIYLTNMANLVKPGFNI